MDTSASAPVLPTAGGVAVLAPGGVRMLDPTSGRDRWSYHRWDLADPRFATTGPRRVAVSPDGRWLALLARVANPRQVWVGQQRDRARLLVFDTVSGTVSAEYTPPEGVNSVRAVDAARVVAAREVDDAPELLEIDHGGATRWRYALGDGCHARQVIPVAADTLLLAGCPRIDGGVRRIDPYELTRITGEHGEPAWSQRIALDDYPPPAATREFESRYLRSSMVVVDDAVVLDVRVHYRGAAPNDPKTMWRNWIGLRITDGNQLWQQPPANHGELSRAQDGEASVGPLWAMDGIVVSTEIGFAADGDNTTSPLRLLTVDAASGESEVHDLAPDVGTLSDQIVPDAVLPQAVLPDGRLVVAYQDPGVRAYPERCLITTWDIATGRELGRLRPAAFEAEQPEWCDALAYELAVVPGGALLAVAGAVPVESYQLAVLE